MSRQLARLAKTATIAATESAAPKPAAQLACPVPWRAIRIVQVKQSDARVATYDPKAQVVPIDPLIEHERRSKPSKAGLGHGCEHCAQPRDTGDDANEPRRTCQSGGHPGALWRNGADLSFRRLAVEQARAGSRDEHPDRSRPIGKIRQYGCRRDRVTKRYQSKT